MSDDSQSSLTLFAAHQPLLCERLHHLLMPLHPMLRADVLYALEQDGKLLSQQSTTPSIKPNVPTGVWPWLTFLVAHYVSPTISPFCANNVAIAVECHISALDLLDDIEDEDQTPIVEKIGAARVLNVSTALLMLSQRAILSLAQENIAPTLITTLLDALQESTLMATAGQHRDLLAEQASVYDFTQEECIEIASWKAGALMRLACRLGALCASADNEQCELFSELGMLLGIAEQLDNDSHDLYHLLQNTLSSFNGVAVQKSRKTDLLRQKKTLPLVLAAKEIPALQNVFSLPDKENEEQYRRTLQEGVVAAWGMSLLYRERAYDCLQKIEARRPISPELRSLLGFS